MPSNLGQGDGMVEPLDSYPIDHPLDHYEVFIAHAGLDTDAAIALADELVKTHELHCFLDADKIREGDVWPTVLKKAMVAASVIVVLVSEHSDDAYYLQEEVAIAVSLHRADPEAYRVIPVLLAGAEPDHRPYGTFILHALRQNGDSWTNVAAAVAVAAAAAGSAIDPCRSISNSTRGLDQLWAWLEPALTDKTQRVPEDYRMRYGLEGGDLVGVYQNGTVAQRASRDELDQRLESHQLRHIEVLDRSMAVNVAIWETHYPERVLDDRSKRLADDATDALADDLLSVLDIVEDAGFWLDDHYESVRQILRRRALHR